jgi:hypothetical protein
MKPADAKNSTSFAAKNDEGKKVPLQIKSGSRLKAVA